MSEFRSVLYAFGTLTPLLILYMLLVWASRRRQAASAAAASGAGATPATADRVPWVAAPPPAVRRRVRAALARLTETSVPDEGGCEPGSGGDKVVDSDVEAGPDATDRLCVICLDGWDAEAADGGSEGDEGATKGKAVAGARTRLPCGHSFHPSCILRWAVKAPRCPLCNDGALAVAASVGVDAVHWVPPSAAEAGDSSGGEGMAIHPVGSGVVLERTPVVSVAA